MKKPLSLVLCLVMLLSTVAFATAENADITGEFVYWSYTDSA